MAQTQTAIRPWSLAQRDNPTILDRLDRVNRERGHFRELIASKLQEEQAAEGGLELSDSDDEDDNADKDDEQLDADMQPTTREELYKIKFEMLQKLGIAHNEVMMALDFVSLAESKDNQLGRHTMSQYLKDNVPPGTLGIDLWQRMPVDRVREEQDATIAYNIHLESLQKSADAILNAAKRLEDNVRKETRYWKELLSVTEKGWPVCRLPGQRGRLGVRFGFSESATEFSRAGIAPLVASDDGSISLDKGTELRSRTIRVTVRSGHDILGSSTPTLPNDLGSIEGHIKHARDALFDEELFREIDREARMSNTDTIHMSESGVWFRIFDGEKDVTIHVELQTREQASTTVSGSSFHDFLAQGVLTTARLLLSQAHRERLRQRSTIPPPLTDVRPVKPTYQILRAVMAFSSHNQRVQEVNSYMAAVADVLNIAGLPLELSVASLHSFVPTQEVAAGTLLDSLGGAKCSTATVRLPVSDTEVSPEISIRVDTATAPDCETTITITGSLFSTLVVTSLAHVSAMIDQGVSRLIAAALVKSHQGWSLADNGAEMINQDDAAPVSTLSVSYTGAKRLLSLRSAESTRMWQVASADKTDDIVTAWTQLTQLESTI